MSRGRKRSATAGIAQAGSPTGTGEETGGGAGQGNRVGGEADSYEGMRKLCDPLQAFVRGAKSGQGGKRSCHWATGLGGWPVAKRREREGGGS